MNLADDHFIIFLMLVCLGLLIWVQTLRGELYKAKNKLQLSQDSCMKSTSAQEGLRADVAEASSNYLHLVQLEHVGIAASVDERMARLKTRTSLEDKTASSLSLRGATIAKQLKNIRASNNAQVIVTVTAASIWAKAVDDYFKDGE